jgi:hypothetical protein
MVCETFAYSDWGACISGQEQRSIIEKSPVDCVVSESEELSRACEVIVVEEAKDDAIGREQSLLGVVDDNLAKRLAGRIILQVEEKGEAWYISPVDYKKYYLGRPADAFQVMKDLGLGAKHDFIIAHDIFPDHVLGRILIDVDDSGKAYYINSVDKKAYYLGQPVDAFQVMRDQGLGITNDNLRKIDIGVL